MTRKARLFRLSCIITRSDQDLANQSNGFDWATIHATAVVLVSAFVLATVAWYAFFATFMNALPSLALGLFCGLLVFMFDQALAASDWELAGVLATSNPPSQYWFKMAARVAVALLLAQATAVGATMALFHDAIDDRLQQNRVLANVAVQDEYRQAKEELRGRSLDPLTARLKQIDEDRSRALRIDEAARATRAQARDRAASARVEAGRELTGGLDGYIAGAGPRHQEALRQEAEANTAEAAAATEFEQAAATLGRVEQERANLLKELAAAELRHREEAAALDGAMEADARYIPVRNDPLLRYAALAQIKDDPVTGPAARSFSHLMNLVLVTFELMVLLIKVVFAPASVYTVRLIARTRAEAAAVAAEYALTLDKIRDDTKRPGLRIVGGTEVDMTSEEVAR